MEQSFEIILPSPDWSMLHRGLRTGVTNFLPTSSDCTLSSTSTAVRALQLYNTCYIMLAQRLAQRSLRNSELNSPSVSTDAMLTGSSHIATKCLFTLGCEQTHRSVNTTRQSQWQLSEEVGLSRNRRLSLAHSSNSP